jgi:hypothetical protein
MVFEGVVAALARGFEYGLSLDYEWTDRLVTVAINHWSN